MRHNQHAPPKMMFLESHKDAHTCTHTHTITKNTYRMAAQRRTLLCVCPAGRETGRHRTHHYDQNTILHNHRGGGGGGQSNLSKTHTHTHTHTQSSTNTHISVSG